MLASTIGMTPQEGGDPQGPPESLSLSLNKASSPAL